MMPWAAGAPVVEPGAKWLASAAPPVDRISFLIRESGSFVSRTAIPKAYTAGAWEVKIPQRWTGSDWVSI